MFRRLIAVGVKQVNEKEFAPEKKTGSYFYRINRMRKRRAEPR